MIRFLVSLLFLTCSLCLIAQEESDPFSGGAESGGGEGGAGGGPLPIELLRFDARAEGHAVALSWSTATEIDNDFFTLERSRDAVRWDVVATIDGAGTHFGQLDYTFRDGKPFRGLSYYRLKQTDFDGSFSYSDIRAVTVEDGDTDIILFPNPARLEVNLLIQADLYEVRILDASGREVLRGNNAPSLDISGLQSGHYTVEVRTLEQRFVRALMVH